MKKKEYDWMFIHLVNLIIASDDKLWNHEHVRNVIKKTQFPYEEYSTRRYEEKYTNFEPVMFEDTEKNVFESNMYKSFYQRVKKAISNIYDSCDIHKDNYTYYIIENILSVFFTFAF